MSEVIIFDYVSVNVFEAKMKRSEFGEIESS